MNLFEDREEAGEELSKFLKEAVDIDHVVVPHPESCQLGLKTAKENGTAISVRLTDFISAPNVPNANIGAVVEDGTIWVDDGLQNELGVSPGHIESSANIKANSLKNKTLDLNHDGADIRGKNVVIVTDGVNSGFREAAVAGSLLKHSANKIFLASPLKSKNVMADINSVVDGFIALNEIPFVSSIDSCYGKVKSPKLKEINTG